ncbi:MAG: HAMP domain-containing histidine kinase [Verrucomicrobiota bacterium]|nr:HAMP domain-containing histidine kinase [Verrucomicrobiota bacterium]
MPTNDSSANSVLQALGYALFVRDKSGALRAIGGAPLWLKELWPKVASGKDSLDSGVSPFLENFLIDANECWRAGGETRTGSGPWIEQDKQGENVELEATALTLDGQPVLLLERLGEAFAAKKAVLQKARETIIAHQRLNSEIQKKEILLHCVAEDMTAALGNVITSLRLLEIETTTPKGQLLLGLASRAAEEQQALIHKVLNVFADELNGFFGQNGAQAKADVQGAIDRAVAIITPLCSEKKVRLSQPATVGGIKVSLGQNHLERVIANLFENAIDRTPPGGAISFRTEDSKQAIAISVEDSGAPVPSDACADMFAKPEMSSAAAQPSTLRLHFCRLIVESGGGEIGCEPVAAGGNRFWIRLPKVAS